MFPPPRYGWKDAFDVVRAGMARVTQAPGETARVIRVDRMGNDREVLGYLTDQSLNRLKIELAALILPMVDELAAVRHDAQAMAGALEAEGYSATGKGGKYLEALARFRKRHPRC